MKITVTFAEACEAIRTKFNLPGHAGIVIGRPKKSKAIPGIGKYPAGAASAPPETLTPTQVESLSRFRRVVETVDRELTLGNKIAAIKAIRMFNQMSLKSAKAVVDCWGSMREEMLKAGRFLDPVFADHYDSLPSRWV